MYCIKCGTKLPEEALYCIKCGFPVPEALKQNGRMEAQENEQWEVTVLEQARNESQASENDGNPEHFHPAPGPPYEEREFIGSNAEFYLEKWAKTASPGSAVSWNWAAFFLSGYWLAYRKMYLNVIIWFIVVAGLGGIMIATEFHHFFWTAIIELVLLCINVGLGMYGNALYYRHMRKKIQKWRDEPTLHSKTSLPELGGTGWIGVILLIVLNVIIGMITFIMMMVSMLHSGIFQSLNEGMTFGTGSDQYGITGIQDHFSAESPIYLQAAFDEPIGTDSIHVMFFKQDDENEVMVGQWDQEVDPSWDSVYFNLYDPTLDGYLDPGHYVVRIYDDNDLLSEGEFDISSFSIDGGSNEYEL